MHGLLSTAVAAVSSTLIRSFLIPDQLSVIGAVGSLLVFLGFIVCWAYREPITKHIRWCVVVSLGSLILLILFQTLFVKTLENYGEPPAIHHFIVGLNMNNEGRTSMSVIGSPSIEELIRAEGWQRIPTWYGPDFYIIQALYVLSYIIFILGVVLALGAASTTKNKRVRTMRPDP